MNDRYCLSRDSKQITLQEKRFTYYVDSNTAKIHSNFLFEKQLKEPINGKSADYQIYFAIDLYYGKDGISYIFDEKITVINEDRPNFPTREEIKLYVSGRYAHFCINAMIALAKERIRIKEEKKESTEFFRKILE